MIRHHFDTIRQDSSWSGSFGHSQQYDVVVQQWTKNEVWSGNEIELPIIDCHMSEIMHFDANPIRTAILVSGLRAGHITSVLLASGRDPGFSPFTAVQQYPSSPFPTIVLSLSLSDGPAPSPTRNVEDDWLSRALRFARGDDIILVTSNCKLPSYHTCVRAAVLVPFTPYLLLYLCSADVCVTSHPNHHIDMCEVLRSTAVFVICSI